jgi:hypothetical protein
MRVPAWVKILLSTWIAALVGALAGRGLAEATAGAHASDRHAPAVTSVQAR